MRGNHKTFPEPSRHFSELDKPRSLSSQRWFSSLMQILWSSQTIGHIFFLLFKYRFKAFPERGVPVHNPARQVPQQSITSLAPGHPWFPSPLATWINSITSCLLVSYAHLSGLVCITEISRQIKIVKLWERQRALVLQCLFQWKIFMVVLKQLSCANVNGVILLAPA